MLIIEPAGTGQPGQSGRSGSASAFPRLFVAVPLPDNVRDALRKLSGKLRDEIPFHKWTHPDDLHITVQFLGETPETKLGDLRETLRDVAIAHCSFPLSLSELDAFGPPSRPSVLWAGLKGATDALSAVQRSVVTAMEQHGYEPESRPYRPHITLARRYDGSRSFGKEALAPFENELRSLEWDADRLVLYRSHLGRTPMYEAFEQLPFRP
jgi:2'-5' RNA ligase